MTDTATRQAAESRAIFGEDITVDLPGLGPTVLRYTNQDLAYVERALTPLMDTLPEEHRGRWIVRDRARTTVVPAGTEGATWDPHANVWEALEGLGDRYPFETMLHLLTAAVRHVFGTHAAASAAVDEMPPHVFNDPNIERALERALAVAFGEGTGPERPTTDTAGDTPVVSTGPPS